MFTQFANHEHAVQRMPPKRQTRPPVCFQIEEEVLPSAILMSASRASGPGRLPVRSSGWQLAVRTTEASCR
eukprot:6187517-Pleurochrysis_carterae.AAC.2